MRGALSLQSVDRSKVTPVVSFPGQFEQKPAPGSHEELGSARKDRQLVDAVHEIPEMKRVVIEVSKLLCDSAMTIGVAYDGGAFFGKLVRFETEE